MVSEDEGEDVLKCPGGLFNFGDNAAIVTNADEEILELYMNLASTSDGDECANPGGLGFLDSTKSILDLELVLTPDPHDSSRDSLAHVGSSSGSGSGRSRKLGLKKAVAAKEVKMEAQIQQDIHALKGRKGDTGSVLWRSSLHLAKHLLTEWHFPPTSPQVPLIDPSTLSSARVLELGAGTGLLALLLHPLCESYTASDQLENLKLVYTNLTLNGIGTSATRSKIKEEVIAKTPTRTEIRQPKKDKAAVTAKEQEVLLEEIDWLEVSKERGRWATRVSANAVKESLQRKNNAGPLSSASSSYSRSPTSPRSSYFPPFAPSKDAADQQYDLILAVDCIYNDSLVQPLIDTLVKFCPPGGKTVVWVVVELRSSDVLSFFLESWLNDPSGPWTIIRLGPDAMGRWEGHRPRWVGWVGWR